MAGTIHVIWRILILGRTMQLLCMVKGYDFVPLAMDDVHRTFYVGHPVNVREIVDWKCPSKIEHDTEC